jgi:hypothetical protein
VTVEQTSGHDRIVVHLDAGGLPYLFKTNPGGTHFTTTFSGMAFTVAGSYGAELQISSVDQHDQYAHGMDQTPNYSVLKEVRVRGDGEGRADIAMGLSGNVCPTISAMTGPPRLVVDFPSGAQAGGIPTLPA